MNNSAKNSKKIPILWILLVFSIICLLVSVVVYSDIIGFALFASIVVVGVGSALVMEDRNSFKKQPNVVLELNSRAIMPSIALRAILRKRVMGTNHRIERQLEPYHTKKPVIPERPIAPIVTSLAVIPALTKNLTTGLSRP